MPMNTQIVVDSRLMFDHVTQTITEGASQVLTQTIPANQANNSLIQWNNLLSIGQNVVIDPYISVEYVVSVIFPATTGVLICPPGVNVNHAANPAVFTPATGLPVLDDPNNVRNANLIFAQYPLSSVCNNLALSINNVDTNIPLSVITAVMRENYASKTMREELLTSCPSDNNKQPLLFSQAANIITEQPNTPTMFCGGKSRCSIIPDSVTPNTNGGGVIVSYTVVYTIIEPLFISPLSVGKGGHGLCNVNSMGIRMQLDNSSGLRQMFNATQGAYASDQYAAQMAPITVNITGANLLLNYLTIDVVDHPISNPSYYDWYSVDVNNTNCKALDAGFTAVPNQSLQSFKLTTIPKYYWLKIMPNVGAGVKPKNLLTGFPITSLKITYGSYGTFIFSQVQLYLCYRRNTQATGVSYAQWLALGTPVCLNPSLDMCSASSFSGESNLGGLMWSAQVAYNFDNINDLDGVDWEDFDLEAGNVPLAYELFITQGSAAFGNGVAIFKNSSVSIEEFSALAKSQPIVSENVVSASQNHSEGGGVSFGGFKSLLSSGAKKLGELAKQHGPAVLKMGLEQLQKASDERKASGGAAGESGGRFGRRRM